MNHHLMNMNHHLWEVGAKLLNDSGDCCKLLAPTWNGFAWVLYEGQSVPCTEHTYSLGLAGINYVPASVLQNRQGWE